MFIYIKNLNNVLGLKWLHLVSNIRLIAFFPPQADFITTKQLRGYYNNTRRDKLKYYRQNCDTCTKLEVLMPKGTNP